MSRFALRSSLLTLVTAVALVASVDAQAAPKSKFTFATDPLTTASVGQNATSVNPAARTSGSGVYLTAVGPTVGVDLIVPSVDITSESIAISLEYARNEGSAEFFSLNGTRFYMSTGTLYFTYVVDGPGNSPSRSTTISASAPLMTTSGSFVVLAATYEKATGIAQILIDGVVVATKDGQNGRPLDWSGAGNAVIGTQLDGGTAGFVTLGQVQISDDPVFGVLPVELTSFTAQMRNTSVHLRWITATETNNYGFEIERSTNRTDWTTVGFVAGSGTTSSERSYNFTDAPAVDVLGARVIHYRLRQIDRDGTVEYSDVISVAGRDAAMPTLSNFPNPFNPSTTISFTLATAQPVTLTVTDATGREVARLIDGASFDAGSHSISFMADGLPSGVYFYTLAGIDGVSTGRMLLAK